MPTRYLLCVFSLLILACSPLKQYDADNIEDQWEDEIARFELADRSGEVPDSAILFYGSSSIRLWETIESDLAPFPVIQRGFGGAALHDAAYYAERVLTPHDYAALVLFVGNDILGNVGDKSPDEMAELFKHIIKTSKEHRPKAPIFYVELTHVPARENLVDKIDAANERMRAVSDNYRRVYFIPTRDLYLDADDKVRTDLFASDRVHQNEKGYARWAERIKSVLLEKMPARRTRADRGVR